MAARSGILTESVASEKDLLEHLTGGDEAFAAIWLDSSMEEFEGGALVEKIRALPEAGEVAIVLLSDVTRIDECRGRWGGQVPVVPKPARSQRLLKTTVDTIRGENRVEPTPIVEAVESAPIDIESEPSHSQMSANRSRILIADDNGVNVRVAFHMLKRLGFDQIDTATNGREALEAHRRARYDVILMDVQMPVMDGLEATRTLRQDFSGDALPQIIALTAGVSREDRARCLEAGMDGFVSKPVRLDELKASIEVAVSKTGASGLN